MYGGLQLPLHIYYAVFGNTYSGLLHAEAVTGIPGLRRFAAVLDMLPDCIVPFARVCTVQLTVPDVAMFALLSVRHLEVSLVGEHLTVAALRCETLTLHTFGWCAVTVADTVRVVQCINGGEYSDRSACVGDITISPKIVEFVNCPHIEHIKCTGYSVDTTNMRNPGLLSLFQYGPPWHSSVGDHRELRAIHIREPLTYGRFYKLQYAILYDDVRFANTISQSEKDADTRAWLDRYGTTCVRVPGSMVDICSAGPLCEYGCRMLKYPPAQEIRILDTAIEDTKLLGDYLPLVGLYLTVLHRCRMDMYAPALQTLSIYCVAPASMHKFTLCFPALTDLSLTRCIVNVQPMYSLVHVLYADCVVHGTPWGPNTRTIELRNARLIRPTCPPCHPDVRVTINSRNINKMVNICKKLMAVAVRSLGADNVQ